MLQPCVGSRRWECWRKTRRALRKLGRRPPPPRGVPPFRLVGESLARLVGNAGARRSEDEQGYEVVSDGDVVP